MIANMCSFFNAGSGTNQSNHMYKLGPVHQGIFERGSKTGSFAYILLPGVVGAYSVVMGKHTGNFDTSDFPFSYLTEEKGKSELTPAMNIFTVGTCRDIQKWPQRDKRKDPEKLDLVHYGMFNPYIVGKMVKGVKILTELAEKTPPSQDFVNYKGVTIHRLLLKATRKYYEMGLKIYAGREIAARLQGITKDTPFEEIRGKLCTGSHEGAGHWIDVGGMFAPANKIEELTNDVSSGDVSSIGDLHKRLRDIYDQYNRYAWEWCAGFIAKQTGTETANLTTENLVKILSDWKSNAVKFNHMILRDAEKEFDLGSRLGYGIDGEGLTRDADFTAVRGHYEVNSFVTALRKETEEIEKNADHLITLLSESGKI
jgi:hypothetical protein